MKIRIARSAAEIDLLRPLWLDLYRQQPETTLFQSFDWNRLAAQCFAAREAPYFVAIESDAGAAIVPAVIRRQGIALAGEELFDYRDVLSLGSPEVLRAAWARLADWGLGLSFKGLRGPQLPERWRELEPKPFVTAPAVQFADIAGDEFADRHPRRAGALRRLARQGVSLHRYCGANRALLRDLYRRKAQQFEATANLFRDSLRTDFLLAAAAIDPEACEIFTLETAGSMIAALVTFREPLVRRCYTIWHDAAWAHYSPGTALLFAVTHDSLLAGIDCDYMTGEQPHKQRFMTAQVPLFQVQAGPQALLEAAGEPMQLAA